MPDQQILDYIKHQRQAGFNDVDIKASLLSAGWQEADINEAMKSVPAATKVSYDGFSTKTTATAQAEIINATIKPEKKKMRLWKKIVLIIVIILIGPPVLLYATFFILSHIKTDGPPPDQADLQLPIVSVPDDQNAFFDLMKINDVIKIGDNQTLYDYVAYKNWDDAKINELLSQNKKAFEHFETSVAKQVFQIPEYSDPAKINIDLKLSPTSNLRNIANLISLRAAVLLKQGKGREAIMDAMKILDTGQKMENSQGSLITYLVGIAIKNTGLSRLQDIIGKTNLSSSESIALVRGLDKYFVNEEGLKTAFKVEHRMGVSTLDSFNRAIEKRSTQTLGGTLGDNLEDEGWLEKNIKISNSFYYEPNNTMALHVDLVRNRIASVDSKQAAAEQEKLLMRVRAKGLDSCFGDEGLSLGICGVTMIFQRNAIGNTLYNLSVASFGSVMIRKDNEDLMVGVSQLLLAIKAYKFDIGKNPDSLTQLVPKYISKIPIDPFSDGDKLQYSKEKNSVFSKGENGTLDWQKFEFSL